ncbi:DUF4333 domain-containing protein [Tsukamurella pseudospumae]|nr:DUF4333 domain-containing protein [Tsukamurella pseudospumae]
MKTKIAGVVTLAAVAPLMVGCSMFGTKMDFGKLESKIADKLNTEYSKLGQKVDSVTCDKSDDKPKPGATFTCDAKLGEVTVPVKVTVKDKDMNVDFVTTKKLYNLATVGTQLAPQVTQQVKQSVTIDCGTGLKAVEPGASFTCPVKGANGSTGTLTLKVGSMDGTDDWSVK